MSSRLLTLVAVCLSSAAFAQPEPSADDANAAFVLEALRTRSALRQGGPSARAAGETLWTSASEFAEIVNRAPPAEREPYLPLLESYSATLKAEAASPSPDLTAVSAVRSSLAEQLDAHATYAAFPGTDRRVAITVRALRGGQPVHGLYVWLDLACCVQPQTTAHSLASTTSPATGHTLPGTFRIRLVRDGNVVGQRDHFIGKSGNKSETIDVMISGS